MCKSDTWDINSKDLITALVANKIKSALNDAIEEDVNLYEDGYVPETDTFTAANTLEDEIDQTDTQETIVSRVVSGGCM